jgi:hypothetical protein
MWKNIEKVKNIIQSSETKTDVLNKLGLKNNGGNYNSLTSFIKSHNIDISHFNFKKPLKIELNFTKKGLEEILVKNSLYKSSNHLKSRLYNNQLKTRICELCGQNENWQGKKMSLILDHINGDRYDNRLENLRIVCPNCNATLETHCRGLNPKKNEKYNPRKKKCISDSCENMIRKDHDYCLSCWKEVRKAKNKSEKTQVVIKSKKSGKDETEKISFEEAMKKRRKVERPSYEQLLLDISELGFVGTGKKYEVSDNSIRKWIKMYQKHGDNF